MINAFEYCIKDFHKLYVMDIIVFYSPFQYGKDSYMLLFDIHYKTVSTLKACIILAHFTLLHDCIIEHNVMSVKVIEKNAKLVD